MNTASDAEDLLALLSEIRAWCQDPVIFSGRSETVSDWSVAQHCEHILKADRLNLRAIEVLLGGGGEEIGESGPTHPVFDQGVIPRGVAKAPDYVMPADKPELESVSLLADRVLSGWTETLPPVRVTRKTRSAQVAESPTMPWGSSTFLTGSVLQTSTPVITSTSPMRFWPRDRIFCTQGF